MGVLHFHAKKLVGKSKFSGVRRCIDMKCAMRYQLLKESSLLKEISIQPIVAELIDTSQG